METTRLLAAPALALALAPALAPAPSGVAAQDDVAEANASALDAASPEARRSWERLLAACRGGDGEAATPPGPITAFHLEANVLTRDGVQTNETDIDYRYLAPDCVRFLLPSRREIGRFGLKQREYWLRDGEEIVHLAGREYEGDRRQIREMHAVARNFVALSDPARLRITRLERLSAPSPDVAPRLGRRDAALEWLRVVSPDFGLIHRERTPSTQTVQPASYAVELGVAAEGLPRLAVIREERRPGARVVARPMLIRLQRYEERADFRIPWQLEVYAPDPAARRPVFAEKPSQEIYITKADLRPALGVADFRP